MEAQEPSRIRIPRWVTTLLTLTAAGLLPWTLWLTFTLPSRHVTEHYDVAWVVFDFALFARSPPLRGQPSRDRSGSSRSRP